MKRQTKFYGLFFIAALVVLIVSAPGQKRPNEIPLRVTFSPVLASTITPGTTMNCNILNDVPWLPYESGGENRFKNTVHISSPDRDGWFWMYVNTNNSEGRYVRLEFDEGTLADPEDMTYCAPIPLYFLANKVLDKSEANIFKFRTLFRYSETIGADGKRYLTNTKLGLNLAKMKAGDTAIVATVVDFWVADDLSTRDYNESSDTYSLSFQYPARVKCNDLDGDGTLEWVISPVQEPYTDTYNKIYYPGGSVFRGLYSNYYLDCIHGWLWFPFELTLDPK